MLCQTSLCRGFEVKKNNLEVLQEFVLRYHYAMKGEGTRSLLRGASVHGALFPGPCLPVISQEVCESLRLPYPIPEPTYAKPLWWFWRSPDEGVSSVSRYGGSWSYTLATGESKPLPWYKDLVPGVDVWVEDEDVENLHTRMKLVYEDDPEGRARWISMSSVGPIPEEKERVYQEWKSKVLG